MLRHKQPQTSPMRQRQQQQRRPLLVHEDAATTSTAQGGGGGGGGGGNSKYTTSSQSLDHTYNSKDGNGVNASSTTKRRLRLFGGLGGGSSSQPQYSKQPTTPPPPPSTIRMQFSSATTSTSSIPEHKYDTRPIYTQPTAEESGGEASSSTPTPAARSTTPPPTNGTTATAAKIPTLPSNQRDSARKVHRKADPPTRQDEEAAAERARAAAQTAKQQAQQQQQRTTTDKSTRSQNIHRPKSRGRTKTPPPPTSASTTTVSQQQQQQQQRQQQKSHPRTESSAADAKASSSNHEGTPHDRKQQQQQQQPSTGPKSVLRNKQRPAAVVEEKKADETERILKVADVVLQQESSRQQQPQQNNATTVAAAPPAAAAHSATLQAVPSHMSAPQQQDQHEDPARTVLSRPFGRDSLPVSVGRNFVVQVSSAEWDADEELWKYRILVQQRPSATNHQQHNNNNTKSGGQQRGSFTTAYTWRSLSDFGWLERALRWEYHGALLIPLLNMALGVANVSPETAVPVEAEALRHWLTDVLNGIRGQGEWLYLDSCSSRHDTSILQSEAMEMFLYRTGSLTQEQLLTFTVLPGGGRQTHRVSESSLIQRLTRTLEHIGSPWTEFCVGPMPHGHSAVEYPHRTSTVYRNGKLPRGLICSSGALATAPSLDMNDSFGAESTARHHMLSGTADHPILLMHALLRNYRETALTVLEKLSTLRPAEEALGMAWKRMAIALTNLFAYEKDVESAKLGDLKVKRENMPFRKVQKSHVDDGLRVLSRCKVDRCEPALSHVRDYLSALLADLSAVGPSVEAFREAQKHAEEQDETEISTVGGSTYNDEATGATNRGAFSYRRRRHDWLPHARSLLSMDRSRNTETVATRFHERFQSNEVSLQDALVRLVQHLPVRMARMAWRYWQTEISHVAELHKAATSFRGKIDVTKEDSISRMLKRHFEEEKEDKMTEILLIQRMLQIGHKEDSIEEPPEVTQKRERALNIAKERLGRWDIKLGLAVMEAIGIKDPNVRVEETTRDLRLVRKYAIGLRECLNRCVEAVGGIRAALYASEGPTRDLREARQQFFKELARLFSGKIAREDTKRPPWNTLTTTLQRKVGVAPAKDPFHWSAVFAPEQHSTRNRFTQNSVGDLACECMDAKDKNTSWLLTCMSELLNDYQERVQQIESYVYMECVGIQLERHFSEKRAAVLSAFEKKTDITTAINVAHKKKLPKLVDELQRKLDDIRNEVTQTTLRESKELHLESKQLKSDIHDLAVRRLVRARETSTDRAVALMSLWAKEEETSAAAELKAIGEAMAALEKQVGDEDLDALVQGGGGSEI